MGENNKVEAYCGLIEVAPKSGWRNQSENHTSMTRTVYNDDYNKCSNRFTETHKAGEYVNRAGREGYKQESRYTSTVKYDNKVQGSTTEYKTQVNVQKVVYPSQTSKTTSGKRYYC